MWSKSLSQKQEIPENQEGFFLIPFSFLLVLRPKDFRNNVLTKYFNIRGRRLKASTELSQNVRLFIFVFR